MMRYEDTTTTVNGIKILARGLGVDSLPNRMAMGFGMCLNAGDTERAEGLDRLGARTRLCTARSRGRVA